jgi:hypothetical protein
MTRQMLWFLIVLLATVGMSCCDPKHDGYAQAQGNIEVCKLRFGVPITEPVVDQGGHVFNILTQCAFPYDPKIQGERP